MGDNLLEWDQIFRVLAIGLIFAASYFVGYFSCWWWAYRKSKRQDREMGFWQKKIDEDTND